VHVDDGVARALDDAGRDRDHAAGRADVKIRGLRAEAIARHPGVVGDAQMKAAVRMRGPDRPVLRAEGAAAGADGDRRPGLGPVEGDADVSAVTAAVNASVGGCVWHVGRVRWWARTAGGRARWLRPRRRRGGRSNWFSRRPPRPTAGL